MKHIFLFIGLFFVLTVPVLAEETAVTDSGRTVILYPDGRWKDAPAAQSDDTSITTPKSATAKAIINRGKSYVAYDPKQWKMDKPEEGGQTAFKHVEGEAYAMTICERMEISLEALKNVAIANAKAAAPDARIISENRRKVNDKNIMSLIIKGTVENIPFTYFGYYYTGKEGTIQVITYTFDNLFQEYKPIMEKFLNGFSVNM